MTVQTRPILFFMLFVAACAPGVAYHPESYAFTQPSAVSAEKWVSVEGYEALIRLASVPDVVAVAVADAPSGGVFTTRSDVEVMSGRRFRTLPLADFELARAFIRAACASYDEDALANTFAQAFDGGYYRFEGLACTFGADPSDA